MLGAALLCDGGSDAALGTVAERLAFSRGVELNVEVVDFSHIRPGLDLLSRLRALPQLTADPTIVVVHRDAERLRLSGREQEIDRAYEMSACQSRLVKLIPVRMTEAWLLADAARVRQVAGNSRGRTPLGIPSDLESDPDPKRTLLAALNAAAETSGRRRDAMNRRFPSLRRQLIETLDVEGPVNRLSSFRAFRDSLVAALTG